MSSRRCRCGQPKAAHAWRCAWCDELERPEPIILEPVRRPLRPSYHPSSWHLHVVWGLTLCARRCMKPAILIYGDEPLCGDCAQATLDRESVSLELVPLLPPLDARDENRAAAWHPSGPLVDEKAPASSDELDELRRQWAVYQERERLL